jgi:hypothetical protein
MKITYQGEGTFWFLQGTDSPNPGKGIYLKRGQSEVLSEQEHATLLLTLGEEGKTPQSHDLVITPS